MANVSEIQNKLFNKLVAGTGINIALYPNIRVHLELEQFKNVAHIKLLHAYVYNKTVTFVLLNNHDKNYLLISGLETELPNGDVEVIDNQLELSFCMLAYGPVVKNEEVNEEQLFNQIFIQTDINDIEWDAVESLFPKIITYEVKTPLDTDQAQVYFLNGIALTALCYNPQVLILPFNADTIKCYLDVVSCGNNEIPLDNVLRSLGSNYWKFCYIDLYRCIERLLLIGWVQNYHQKDILKTLTPDDLFKCMYEILKVEKHEWENMEYLFMFLPTGITSMLDPIVNGERYYKYIYELRNKLVHFQKDETVINAISESDWNVVIQFMLLATIELYDRLDTYVKRLPSL